MLRNSKWSKEKERKYWLLTETLSPVYKQRPILSSDLAHDCDLSVQLIYVLLSSGISRVICALAIALTLRLGILVATCGGLSASVVA
jgi:hypothetical protein